MMIARIYKNLQKYLTIKKVLILYGPRQVGKTTLITEFLKTYSGTYRYDTGDDIDVRNVFLSESKSKLLDYAGSNSLIVIDEAQRIAGIGLGLKILVDALPCTYFLITGSSSIELMGQVGEPLTGRKKTLFLYPLSQKELIPNQNRFDMKRNLESYLLFGGYPEVFNIQDKNEKEDYLKELTHSYLLKDILEMDKVKNSQLLLDLLRSLAFQIGGEVSLSELSRNLGINAKTVARYIDLLEKSFIIYGLRGFSRNLRKEITKMRKFYFYDNGIRNALISNFNPISLRNDIGMLWENFIFMERLKKRSYDDINANIFFWRTWDQEEIDLIEEREGHLFGYEFKYKSQKKLKIGSWQESYPNEPVEVVDSENYPDFIL
jgi:predicted AAA+ superfamily ATPase